MMSRTHRGLSDATGSETLWMSWCGCARRTHGLAADHGTHARLVMPAKLSQRGFAQRIADQPERFRPSRCAAIHLDRMYHGADASLSQAFGQPSVNGGPDVKRANQSD